MKVLEREGRRVKVLDVWEESDQSREQKTFCLAQVPCGSEHSPKARHQQRQWEGRCRQSKRGCRGHVPFFTSDQGTPGSSRSAEGTGCVGQTLWAEGCGGQDTNEASSGYWCFQKNSEVAILKAFRNSENEDRCARSKNLWENEMKRQSYFSAKQFEMHSFCFCF